MTDLTKKKDAALAAIQKIQVLAELDEQRVNALGKKGWVSLALKTLGGMSPEERAEAAPAIQEVRNAIAEAINSKKEALESEALEKQLADERLDLTLPAPKAPVETPVAKPAEPIKASSGQIGNGESWEEF